MLRIEVWGESGQERLLKLLKCCKSTAGEFVNPDSTHCVKSVPLPAVIGVHSVHGVPIQGNRQESITVAQFDGTYDTDLNVCVHHNETNVFRIPRVYLYCS